MMRYLKGAKRRWLKFAEIMGNIQITILLTLIFGSLLLILAVPFRLLGSRIVRRNSKTVQWISREPISHPLDSMSKQG